MKPLIFLHSCIFCNITLLAHSKDVVYEIQSRCVASRVCLTQEFAPHSINSSEFHSVYNNNMDRSFSST